MDVWLYHHNALMYSDHTHTIQPYQKSVYVIGTMPWKHSKGFRSTPTWEKNYNSFWFLMLIVMILVFIESVGNAENNVTNYAMVCWTSCAPFWNVLINYFFKLLLDFLNQIIFRSSRQKVNESSSFIKPLSNKFVTN